MNPARPIGFALIGTGEGARNLATGLKLVQGAELRCVVSRDLTKASAFAEAHGATASMHAYASYQDMLDRTDADAVIIATPDRLHAEQAIAAARAGKHVFVEKPMASRLEDAYAMRRACQEAGVTLGVGYHQRWNPWHRKVRAGLLPDPAFGAIRHVRFRWTKSVDRAEGWRVGDLGRWWALGAYGTHVVDLAAWMLEPHCGHLGKVRALLSKGRLQSKADESALVTMRYANGATAEIFVSMVHRRERLIEIECERGTLVLRDTLGVGPGWLEGQDGARTHAQDANLYALELADFIDAVRTGRPPEVDGNQGARNVQLLEDIEASANP